MRPRSTAQFDALAGAAAIPVTRRSPDLRPQSALMATTTKAAPPMMVKIEAIPCTAMPAAATASSEPTPSGVLRAAP